MSPLAATIDVSILGWATLGLATIALLSVEQFAFRDTSLRVAAVWSTAWLALALAFGAALWAGYGATAGTEYFAGYALERSLSIDNVFVFAVILGAFAVADTDRQRVLGWGIGVALALRLVFILAGAALLSSFHATYYVFGAILVYTAVKLARHKGAQIDPERNVVLRLVRRRLKHPLAPVLIVIATTDLVFAFDSIPAIFAITSDPFIVFAANAFAMLGLRALYFLVAGLLGRIEGLDAALSLILAFIGVKMLLIDVWHPPVWLSLAVIAAVFGALALRSRATRLCRRRRTRHRATGTP
jgi:tellurite resistance protein TerC